MACCLILHTLAWLGLIILEPNHLNSSEHESNVEIFEFQVWKIKKTLFLFIFIKTAFSLLASDAAQLAYLTALFVFHIIWGFHIKPLRRTQKTLGAVHKLRHYDAENMT